MNSRDPFPDEELRRRIMDFIMAAGQTLLENGAEVFRVEQTMEIMARSFHLREFHVYVLTNGIFCQCRHCRDQRGAQRTGAHHPSGAGGGGERAFPPDRPDRNDLG